MKKLKTSLVDADAENVLVLFEAQVIKTPKNIALVSDSIVLNYETLNIEANRLAHYLCRQGVGPEKLVALYMDRSVQAIISILAILKAGGAYLPLNTADPLSRLQHILKSSGCEFLIMPSQNALLENVHEYSIYLDKIAGTLKRLSDSNLPIIINPDNLAYVMYTSGSTGQPKGVEIEHKNIINLAVQYDFLNISENSHVLQFSSLHFDVSVTEMWMSLLSGACLYIPDETCRCDPVALSHYIDKYHISNAILSPTSLLNMPIPKSSTLHTLVVTGDACSKKIMDDWQKHCRVINAYGPTEITVWATMSLYDGEQHRCIGKPLKYVKCYVLDEQQEIVKKGDVGELYVAGKGLARGYRRQPALTLSRFIEWTPKDDKNKEPIRLYKTGDRVKRLLDGQLCYIGRTDFEIKFNSIRINPAEIELPLNQHDLVKQSVVMLKKQGNQSYLIAYIIPKIMDDDKTKLHEKLISHLKKLLPSNRLPNAFMILEKFPLSSTGKIDRNALPMPTFQDVIVDESSLTEDERILSDCWIEVLNLPQKTISPESNFFILGGSSLLAAQLALSLSNLWNLPVTIADIFEFPTLKNQLYMRNLRQQTEYQLPITQLIQRDRPAVLPLSFAQRRLWLAYQSLKDERPQTYNVHIELSFAGKLDQNALKRALQCAVDRHESLRTTFQELDEQTVNRYQMHLEEVILDNKTSSEVQRIIDEYCAKGFDDLTKPPLIRAMLVTLSKDKHVLCLVFHHIVIDGIALPILIRDLNAFYNAAVNQLSEITLPILPVQYPDFALWEQQLLKAGHYQSAFEYWKEQLAGVSGLFELPFDNLRPDKPSYHGDSHIFYFPKEITDALKDLAKQQGTSLFTLLLSSIAALLYQYNQQDDFVIGLAYGKRPDPILNELIGFFVNMLPIRIEQSNDLSFLTSLNKIRNTLSQAYKHNAPLEEIIQELTLPRYSGRHPLFQVIVTMHDIPELKMDFTNLQTTLWQSSLITASHLKSAKFDLNIEMECMDDHRLAMKIEYSTDVFLQETIKRIAKQWLRLCESIIKSPDQAIDTLSLLNDEEKQQCLAQWNQPTIHPCAKETIVSLFEEQVQQYPDSIAVIDGDVQLNYHDLNKSVNQLANYLLQVNQNIKADHLIAVMLDRSAAFIISVLAILKTGAAYLPLDQELPQKRLKIMLQDAQVEQLITKQAIAIKKNLYCLNIKVVSLDDKEVEQVLLEQSDNNLNKAINSANLAYIIYTSGSTGKPKGVMVEHKNVTQLVKNISYIELTHNDTVGHVCNVTFDVSVFEIFGTLLKGARLIVYPKSILLDITLFKKSLVEGTVNVLVLPTALFYNLLISDINIFASINYVIFIGEKLQSTKILVDLYSHSSFPQYLVNAYGPTEATVFSTSCLIQPEMKSLDNLPIGKPICGVQAYVLNKQLEPVSEGVLGELYVAGLGVARGYLNQDHLEYEKFIVNPFLKGHDRLYRTGDLVRYQSDNLFFVKRSDKQVKISGYRVELEEIERVLLTNPSLKEALVLKKLVDGHPVLLAYVVPKTAPSDSQIYKAELRTYLIGLLPNYMLPTAFQVVNALPLNSNGKIDRAKLMSIDFNLGRKQVMPVTATEKRLTELWQKVLQFHSSIGIFDNFFMLGGSSLLAIQLTSLIHQEFCEIPYSDLFSQPTIQSQAQLIETPEKQRVKPINELDFLKKESELDEDICLSTLHSKISYPTTPKIIFLTGVTGFLGVFLLDELLRGNNATIYCLVRAKDIAHAKDRFLKTLKKYRLDMLSQYLESRIFLKVGDVSKIKFGLSDRDYEILADRIDLIYHSASGVNFVKPYSALKGSNVIGVKNMLRFAIYKKIKPLHYISTAAVFSFLHYFQEVGVLEEEEIDWSDGYCQSMPRDLGYVQSKSVAEKLIWQASKRGIPVAIHRSGFILCHSQTGAGSTDQLWTMLIKDCLALGIFPRFSKIRGEFITVDFASQAIIHISKQATCLGKAFHIVPTHENNITTDELFSVIQELGYSLKSESLQNWRTQLQSYITAGDPSDLALLMPLFTDSVKGSLTLLEVYENSPEYSITNLNLALAGSGITCPEIGSAIVSRYLDYLISGSTKNLINKAINQHDSHCIS